MGTKITNNVDQRLLFFVNSTRPSTQFDLINDKQQLYNKGQAKHYCKFYGFLTISLVQSLAVQCEGKTT